MFSNELELCKKILSKGSLIQYHDSALGTGIRNFKRIVACRQIKVNKKYNFECIPGCYDKRDVLEKSYALMYRSCPSDSSTNRPCYFGDLRIKIKNGEPTWSEKVFRSNLLSPLTDDTPDYILRFRKAVETQFDILWAYINDEIKKINVNLEVENIKSFDGLFIHFDLSDPLSVTHWYDIPKCIETMDSIYLSHMRDEIFQLNKDTGRYSILKSLVHTLTSGEEKNDNQFPDFNLDNRYKSLSLHPDELKYMFYHDKILEACKIFIPNAAPFHFRVVPSGDFTASAAKNYLEKLGGIREASKRKKEPTGSDVEGAEDQINLSKKEGINKASKRKKEPSVLDTEDVEDQIELSEEEGYTAFDPNTFFEEVVRDSEKEITSFDLILVREGANVSMNVAEFNNIARSYLLRNLHRLNDIALCIQKKHKLKFTPLISTSFYKIYRNIGKGEKYQKKFVSMLHKIYRGAYYGDADLKRIFLERIMADIRSVGFSSYHGTKIAYDFLEALNQNLEEENVLSKSKELGKKCAFVAWPMTLIQGSYEKAQIGLANLRIKSLGDVTKFLGDASCGVKRHEGETKNLTENGKVFPVVVRFDGAASREANKILEDLGSNPESFNREDFVLGLVDGMSFRKYLALNDKKDQ